MADPAPTVVVGFDEVDPGSYPMNRTLDGFRFSPRCHMDIGHLVWENPETMMGFDTAGCSTPGFFNAESLSGSSIGLYESSVYIDYFGASFSFLSFDMWTGPGVYVTSSKGGYYFASNYTQQPQTFSLNGSQWKDVEWIEFVGGCPGSPCIPLDNLTFVASPAPEANSFSMAAFGLLLVGAASYRRRRHQSFDAAPAING